MKHLITITLISLMVGCTTPATNPVVVTEKDEDALREVVVSIAKAYEEQDTVLLDELLHEDYLLIDDNGDKYSKSDEMSYVAEYGPTYDEFDFKVIGINLFNNGTAVILGSGTMKGVSGAEAYITTYKSSDVFIKDDGKWKAIVGHVSGVKEETFPMAPSE